MHKLPISYTQPPTDERPTSLAIKALRLLWQVLCWTIAFGAVVVTGALLRR